MCHIGQGKLQDKVYAMLESGGIAKVDAGFKKVLDGITFISKFLVVENEHDITPLLNTLCAELSEPLPTDLYDFDTGDMLCKWSIIGPLFTNGELKNDITNFHKRIEGLYNKDTKECFNKHFIEKKFIWHNLLPNEVKNVGDSINKAFKQSTTSDKDYTKAVRMALSRRLHITLKEHRIDLIGIATKRLHALGEGNIETNILTEKRDNFGSKESMSSLSILNGHLANLSSTMFTYFQMQLTSYILKYTIHENKKIDAHSLRILTDLQKSLYNIHETKDNIFGRAIDDNVDGDDDVN